jgi:hypothetical protein
MATIQTQVPVAPRSGIIGSSTSGGHVLDWRSCKPFDASLSFELMPCNNPWRAVRSVVFFDKVLSQKPATIGALLQLAAKAGFKAGEAQRHLRWFYTWGNYCKIGGKFWAEVKGSVAPAAPRKGKKS